MLAFVGRWAPPALLGGLLAAHAMGADATLPHWAFLPVQRPAVPSVPTRTGGVVQPMDAFVQARLAREHVVPSPEAPRATLIRRIYLVMLGVPPTPEEVQAFVQDPATDAYERLVERVLEDPRLGERWARHWLDVVRFAESNGFETNRERLAAWRYRDYVIAAFNQDKPYDQFVREQVAGDALGAPVATGFLVGGPVDIVKSPDPALTAQQRADELDDMVATTGTAFLGLTLGCARCHTHKFDPITQSEYHGMVALLSGVQHGERDLPPAPQRVAQLAALDARIRTLETRLAPHVAKDPETPAAQRAQARPPVDFARNEEAFPPVEARYLRFTILASSGAEPCIDELEAWAGDRNVALASAGTIATASGTLPGHAIHQLAHINDGKVGNARSWISHEPGRGWVQLEFKKPEPLQRVVWGRDREGSFKDRLPTRYRIEVALDTNRWQRVAGSADRAPFPGTSQRPATPTYDLAGLPAPEADAARRDIAALDALRKERTSLAANDKAYAGTFSQPGETRRFHRGDPLQPREAVAPATLSVFNPIALDAKSPEQERRLALARWLSSPTNPLTARVIVNRVWQHHFGAGLVDTPNDLGRNGARPTHPDLLDWLASELVSEGWSLKKLHRRILLSATWRQSSAPRPEAQRVDAASRLLWRFPPRRLEAEAIRDSILAICGNLNPEPGGPGFYLHDVDRENVYHYHPKEHFGPAESRRMVYAFKVRMEQDAIFGSFDCPDGSLVTPRRSASTTPLQALNLFNSRFVLDQSATFAARVERESGPAPADRVRRAWALAYQRAPDDAELRDATGFAEAHGTAALCRALLNSSELLFIP